MLHGLLVVFGNYGVIKHISPEFLDCLQPNIEQGQYCRQHMGLGKSRMPHSRSTKPLMGLFASIHPCSHCKVLLQFTWMSEASMVFNRATWPNRMAQKLFTSATKSCFASLCSSSEASSPTGALKVCKMSVDAYLTVPAWSHRVLQVQQVASGTCLPAWLTALVRSKCTAAS